MSATTIVKLAASDATTTETVDVPEEVAVFSGTIKNMLADFGDENVTIPLPGIQREVLVKAMKFAEYHVEAAKLAAASTGETDGDDAPRPVPGADEWSAAFMDTENATDQSTMVALMLAGNYLDMQPLLRAGTEHMAKRVKGKNAEEIRQEFKLKNMFTPEQEKALREKIDAIE